MKPIFYSLIISLIVLIIYFFTISGTNLYKIDPTFIVELGILLFWVSTLFFSFVLCIVEDKIKDKADKKKRDELLKKVLELQDKRRC